MNLREMAEKARAEAAAQQEALEREARRERGRKLQGLLQQVLGVEVADPETDEIALEGLRFGIGYDGYRDTLILLRSCPDCGGKLRDAVDGLETLGDLLASPRSRYHACSSAYEEHPGPQELLLGRIAVALEMLAEEARARRDRERAEIEARWRAAWDLSVAWSRRMETMERRTFGAAYLTEGEREGISATYQRAEDEAGRAEDECRELERAHPWLEPIAKAARQAEAERFEESLKRMR